MENNKLKHSCYEFHSLTSLYKGLPAADTNLEIYEYGSDAVEAKLINMNYKNQRSSLKLQFIYLILCFTIYILAVVFKLFLHLLYIDVILTLWFILVLWRLSNLVEFEKFILCYDFGIHLQIQKYFGKQNRFIPSSSVHDVVINEVIEDLDFRYLLILRTKGKFFHKTPIICVFKEFKPSYSCLSLIYKHINKVIVKNVKDYR